MCGTRGHKYSGTAAGASREKENKKDEYIEGGSYFRMELTDKHRKADVLRAARHLALL